MWSVPARDALITDSMNRSVSCPYCGEENTIVVDESGGTRQRYVEDCQVCCQPWEVIVITDHDGDLEVELRTLSE